MGKLIKKISFTLIFIILIGVIIFYYVINPLILKGHKEVKVTDYLSINFNNGSKVVGFKNKKISFKIINYSKEKANYFIEFVNPINIKDVNYTLKKDNKEYKNGKVNSFNTIITEYINIAPDEEHEYTLYFESTNYNIYKLTINVNEQSLKTSVFSDVIIKNNPINNPKTLVGESPATEDEGLISCNDDYGTSYYFRGNVLNNYVKIENFLFRILRINGDGSVRLVLNNAIDENLAYYTNKDDISFNNSDIKVSLDNWLNGFLTGYIKYIANHKYCEERINASGGFNSYNRISVDKNPSLICLGNLFTSKISYLTADDALYAGATINDNNTSFFLYNAEIGKKIYLLTPSYYKNNVLFPYVMNEEGKITSDVPGTTLLGVRPVITLVKTAIVEGDGSINNPYTLTKE
ncbi:MAG: hypothetical protein GX951_03950 [Mollicutes bacterium]|nr:hypothetical protein [Mollicutes bacterium]